MSVDFTYRESKQYKGILHWRCEFERETSALWIPVPYDDLLLEPGACKHSVNLRRPSSKSVEKAYPKGCVLYGTRAPLNMFMGLHNNIKSGLDKYSQSNAGVKSLTAYAKNTDKFLANNCKSIDISAMLSDRTLRRRMKSISGLSQTQLRVLYSLHDFLSTACGYGDKNVTLTNSLSPNEYYDQPHFNKKFLKVFGCSPSVFFEVFNSLPEQLLAVSYKRMPDFHASIVNKQKKEI